MPKLRKTPRDIGNAAFRKAVTGNMAAQELSAPKVAKLYGYSLSTFRKHKANPDAVTIKELRFLFAKKLMSENDLVEIISCKEAIK